MARGHTWYLLQTGWLESSGFDRLQIQLGGLGRTEALRRGLGERYAKVFVDWRGRGGQRGSGPDDRALFDDGGRRGTLVEQQKLKKAKKRKMSALNECIISE